MHLEKQLKINTMDVYKKIWSSELFQMKKKIMLRYK